MSGRIRTIKPELLEDAVTAGLSDMAFRLFISCILLADDHGRLRFEPAFIRGTVYWARDVDAEAFTLALAELEPLVMAYVVKGQRYGAIRNWKKHQRVDKPGKPRLPEPPPETLANVSRDSREDLAPDLRSPISDPDPEGDLPRARTREVADAPPEEPEEPEVPPPVDASPPTWRDVLPPDGPPPLDAPLPPDLRARADAIVARTGVVDVDVETSWRKYVAWLVGRLETNRDLVPEQGAVSEGRWVRWVEDDCSAARRRQHEREWSGLRLVATGGEVLAPYHRPWRPAEDGAQEPAGRPPAPVRGLPRPAYDETAREAARRLAEGDFG